MRLKLLAILCALLMLPDVLLAAPLRQESGHDAPLLGLNYGPFREGQGPGGEAPSAEQLREDLALLAEKVNVIRLYSSTGVAETIIAEAEAVGVQVVAQAWIGSSSAANEQEIAAAIALANAYPNVIGVLVGSEVLLRGDLGQDAESILIGYVEQVREAVSVPVGYADNVAMWQTHPDLLAAVDWVGVHSYGFWGCSRVEEAAQYAVNEWRFLAQMPALADQRVILFETGWPSANANESCADATAGSEDAQRIFVQSMLDLANVEGIDLFLFEFADEPWKCEGGVEALVGCHWGLVNVDRTPRPAWDLLSPAFASRQNATVLVADPGANCRAEPSADAAVIAVVPNCTDVMVLQDDGNTPPEWMQVYGRGGRCWIGAALLRPETPPLCAFGTVLQAPTPVPTALPEGVRLLCVQADPEACNAVDPASTSSVTVAGWQALGNEDWAMALNCACRADALAHENWCRGLSPHLPSTQVLG